jgi:hypothetical protein
MKNGIFALILVLVVVVFLAGCASTAPKTPAAGNTTGQPAAAPGNENVAPPAAPSGPSQPQPAPPSPPPAEVKNCADSDNGDINVKGVLTFQNSTFEDVCTSPKNLGEYYCDKDTKQYKVVECPTGYECKDGACTAKPIVCKDSDGMDTAKAGVVTLDNGNGFPQTFKDKCVNTTAVQEYYCDGSEAKSVILDCGPKFGCETSSGTCTFPK